MSPSLEKPAPLRRIMERGKGLLLECGHVTMTYGYRSKKKMRCSDCVVGNVPTFATLAAYWVSRGYSPEFWRTSTKFKPKLTATAVRDIRENTEGLSQKELAHRFGVTPSTICVIVNRKSWCQA